MKKFLFLLLLSFGANANQFEFEACNTDWRVRHHKEYGELWLDRLDTGSGSWKYTVNRNYDKGIKDTQTPEQFLQDFLDQVNNKLSDYCAENGGGQIPTDDWLAELEYMIVNGLEYDSTSNSVVIK